MVIADKVPTEQKVLGQSGQRPQIPRRSRKAARRKERLGTSLLPGRITSTILL
jgi:hypothetical protein